MEEFDNIAIKAKKDQETAVESAYDYLEHFDILETITNVGNDEVFTPRNVCDMMLDSLPEEVWHNPDYKWLNPATKNGIFEREISIRLNEGLKEIIPNEEIRKKHILQNMVFSIGQTKFTANVARRTLYYCCDANRKSDDIKGNDGHLLNGYAIGNGTWFDDYQGNIKTPNTSHEFNKKDKCIYCGISKESKYNDMTQREQYAYEFIHYKKEDLLKHLQDRFFKGDRNMKFDIIIGNPPYQLSDGGGIGKSSAKPIYNLFVQQSLELNPKYLCMIIPSRWMSGGKGLDEFRNQMINDRHLRTMHDFLNPKECFPNNSIKGGVCFFVWDRNRNDKCNIYTRFGKEIKCSKRYLKEGDCDIFIRDEMLIGIKNKVDLKNKKRLNTIVSNRKPYGLDADITSNSKKSGSFSLDEIQEGYKVLGLDGKQKRTWFYLNKNYEIPKFSNCLNKYKVFIAKAYGCGIIGEAPSTPVLSTPGELCTETFLEIGPFETRNEASNLIKYIKTKFFRLMVGIKKQTQNTTSKVYEYVPLFNFSNNSDVDWNLSVKEIDQSLYKKFNFSEEEISYIEENIEEMN